ncbi:MAG: GTPase Era [Spirochaetales bacterium]|nr:GTPase Era [Spirochaetales bacterium]
MKSAFIELIGRPSTGKSSLLNRICGHKISIISNVPQTTRNKVRGIYTEKRGQLVFIDTPGFHSSEKKFNTYLKDLAVTTLNEVDIVLYLLDVTRAIGHEEETLISLMKNFKQKLVIGLNKIDVTPNYEQQFQTLLKTSFDDAPKLSLSCKNGQGVQQLLSVLFEKAPEGELYYPDEYYTDQTPEFRISEIVREKVILNTRQEVPHAVYIEIADMEMRQAENTLWVRGFICVERESQKGIIVGKGGDTIKKIMMQAREDVAVLFPYSLELDFRVKVRSKWKRNDMLLKKLIM